MIILVDAVRHCVPRVWRAVSGVPVRTKHRASFLLPELETDIEPVFADTKRKTYC